MPEPKLNPQIKDVEVGIRKLRNIKIYPLSVRDQLKMKEIIRQTLDTLFSIEMSKQSDTLFVGMVIDIITENLERIIPLITDPLIEDGEEVDILAEMSNNQFSDVISIVYEENFSFLLEKVTRNIEKVKEKMQSLSPTNTPLPKSVSITDINQETFSEEDSEKTE